MNKITHFNFPGTGIYVKHYGYLIEIEGQWGDTIGKIEATYSAPNLDDPNKPDFTFKSEDFHLGTDEELTHALYKCINERKTRKTNTVLQSFRP